MGTGEVLPFPERQGDTRPARLAIDGLERNVQRINGERVHLHQLSDESLGRYLEYAYERRLAADRDMAALLTEQSRRVGATADYAPAPQVVEDVEGRTGFDEAGNWHAAGLQS